MFCPRCGNELVRHDGYLYCEAGEMGLSQKMEEALTGAVERTPVEPVAVTAGSVRARPWVCPRCRHALVSTGDNRYQLEQRCPQCSLTLTRSMIYQLVELHPHKRETVAV